MAPGDALLLYSDGVSEAMDLRRQEFGEDRLQEAWRRHGTLPPAECVAKLMADGRGLPRRRAAERRHHAGGAGRAARVSRRDAAA